MNFYHTIRPLKKYRLRESMMIFILSWVLIVFSSFNMAPPDYVCQLRGVVYVTENRAEADFIVYLEEYEGSADLKVYAEENKLFTDKPGMWHFTDNKAFARFLVFFTEIKGEADFSIYYTDVPTFAGCK